MENPPTPPDTIYRHSVTTRLWHWVNAGVMVVMLMSGLCILNAHPRLYWGEYGANHYPAWLEIGSTDNIGYLMIGTNHFDTTGVLGVSENQGGSMQPRAFPSWATLPASGDLALARRWHITFAWLFLASLAWYGLVSLFSGHLWRDLVPHATDMRPRSLWAVCRDHAMLRFPKGPEAAEYNPMQKLSYCLVLLVLLPLMVLSGLCMSPAFNAVAPWILDLMGGRQSARSIHFIVSGLLVMFVVVHIAMVLAVGPWNHIRSIITGRYRLPGADGR